MATYRVNATGQIRTTIEPEGSLRCDSGEVENFCDDTSYDYHEVEQDIAFTFEVKARSEDEASDRASEVLDEIAFDSYGVEWEIDNVEIDSVEKIGGIESLTEALTVLRDFVSEQSEDEDVQEALDYVLGHLNDLTASNLRFSEEIAELRSEMAALRQASQTPFGPAEPEAPAEPEQPGFSPGYHG